MLIKFWRLFHVSMLVVLFACNTQMVKPTELNKDKNGKSANGSKTLQGYDINGSFKQCKTDPSETACTMDAGPNEEFQQKCTSMGFQSLQCGCHSYLCSGTIVGNEIEVLPGNVTVVKLNDIFRIRVSSNASTGYKWNITKHFESNVKLISEKFESACSEESIGCGGHLVYKYQVVGSGSATQVMANCPPSVDCSEVESETYKISTSTESVSPPKIEVEKSGACTISRLFFSSICVKSATEEECKLRSPSGIFSNSKSCAAMGLEDYSKKILGSCLKAGFSSVLCHDNLSESECKKILFGFEFNSKSNCKKLGYSDSP